MSSRPPVQPSLFGSVPGPPVRPHPLVDQVAEWCREFPRRPKWLIVARHATGHAVGDRLARSGVSWVNLHVVTPTELAARMAAPTLLARGVSPALEPLGPALVMRLLRGLDAAPYFQPMADQPSLAAALWRTLRELRFAALPAADLPPSAFASTAKHAEVTALLAAYQRWLEGHRAADLADLFVEATRDRQYCPIGHDDLVVEWPDAEREPVVRRFLDALPGVRRRPRVWRLPHPSSPGRLVRPDVEEVPATPATDAGRLVFLRDVAAAPRPFADATLHLFHAGGRQAELGEGCRRVLAAGWPLDEVEIDCLSEQDAWHAWETCVRLGWPATLGPGLPAAFTRPGQALMAWGQWIEGGFSSAALRRLLQSGWMAPAAWSDEAGDDPLTPPRAGRLLLEAGASWGRTTFADSLGAFAEQQEARARAPGESGDLVQWRRRRARQARQLASWIDGLIAGVPDAGPTGSVALGVVLRAARALLERDVRVASELDAASREAIAAALDELAVLDDQEFPLAHALRLVRESVEATRVGRDRARPGHLHIAMLDEAGDAGRAHALVIGLEQGRVAPVGAEDPVLLDAERLAISAAHPTAPPLKTSIDRQRDADERVYQRLAHLGMQASTVTLSFSCHDTRDFRETQPSALVLQAYRLLRGDATLGYGALAEWLGEPHSAVPRAAGHAATPAQWWLSHCRVEGARSAVLAASADLAAGLAADARRASPRFNAHDGLVVSAAARLNPTLGGASLSPTALERLAHCPFSYLLREGLGIRPLEEAEPDPDQWLDPPTRGRVLHAIYAAISRRARDAGRRVSVDADLDWALEHASARLAALRRELPPISDLVAATESTELLDDVRNFVEADAAASAGEPVGFEVAFGRAGTGEGEPLDSPEPLVLEVGRGRRLMISGRIDRIDRVGPHRYEVVDYKTGRFWPDEFKGIFAGGLRLQHAIYARAAEGLLRRQDPRARVVRGVYWFPTSRGYGRRHLVDVVGAGELEALLGRLVDVIEAGAFAHQPDRRLCERCDLRAACGTDPWARAQRKLAHPDNVELAAWIDVRSHE